MRAYRGLARAMWAARISEAPPGQIEFARHPWLVSAEKLKRDDRLEAALLEPRDLREDDASARKAAPGGPARRRARRCYADLRLAEGR